MKSSQSLQDFFTPLKALKRGKIIESLFSNILYKFIWNIFIGALIWNQANLYSFFTGNLKGFKANIKKEDINNEKWTIKDS